MNLARQKVAYLQNGVGKNEEEVQDANAMPVAEDPNEVQRDRNGDESCEQLESVDRGGELVRESSKEEELEVVAGRFEGLEEQRKRLRPPREQGARQRSVVFWLRSRFLD